MNIRSTLRAWYTNHLYRRAWKKRRKQLLALCATRTPEFHFAGVKGALEDLQTAMGESGAVPLPNSGICFNAGFLGAYTGIPTRRQHCQTFIALLWEYNKKVRGIDYKTVKHSWAFPFQDLDMDKMYVSWEDEAGRVRREAIRWILMQIEYYELDRP